MKIGILTMHKVLNYGSALQAYALQEILVKKGCKVEIIDYDFPYVNYNLKDKLLSIIYFLRYSYIRKRIIGFKLFYKKYFNLSIPFRKHRINKYFFKYDAYVTGSDQVWNPKYIGSDTTFLLDFVPESNIKISYGSSFSCKQIPNDIEHLYKKYLLRYNNLSVREKNAVELVDNLINKKPHLVLDPTLLLDADDWSRLLPKESSINFSEGYILVYSLTYAFNPFPYMSSMIEELHSKTGLKVLSLMSPISLSNIKCQIIVPASPIEFLGYIKNAAYVVTNSFHGVAFSINFQKNLLAITQRSDDDRIYNLLEELDLINCAYELNSSKKLDIEFLDTKVSSNKLLKMRDKSKQFLFSALNI